MDEGENGHDQQKKMTHEELLKEVQAAEDAGEASQEGSEEIDEIEPEQLDEEDTKIYEAITKDNMKTYLAEALAYKQNKDYEQACNILKIILMKGEALFGDPLHADLASYYFLMGDFLLEEIEEAGEQPAPNQAADQSNQNAANANGTGGEKQVKTDVMNTEVDAEALQSAWENLETARLILQRRVDDDKYGEEEKKSLLSRLATVLIRMGQCETWQDRFKEAVEAYSHALFLRESVEDPNTSRGIAEIYYMMANATLFMPDELITTPAIEYFKKAAKVLENILIEKYEKAGIEIVIDPSQQIKRSLITPRDVDDDKMKDIKGVLEDLYQRMEDTLLEEQVKAQVKAEKEKEERENQQTLNAFGKPVTETEEKKVKNLGKKPATQEPQQVQSKSEIMEEKTITAPVPASKNSLDEEEEIKKDLRRVKPN